MEITVIAVKDSREALSTLKIERNNIDLIVTDYYMPDMNGLQLKKQITQEYGNLPVIGKCFCNLHKIIIYKYICIYIYFFFAIIRSYNFVLYIFLYESYVIGHR